MPAWEANSAEIRWGQESPKATSVASLPLRPADFRGSPGAFASLPPRCQASPRKAHTHFAEDPYKENPVNRCYLCKSNLYEIARAEASRRSIPWIVDGVNFDDLGDYRPGLEAAAESAIRHPLADAELTKSEIRALSKELGLRTWHRPASPCLSSRFPYGTPISPAGLEKVARGEKWLKSRGLCECRVRYYDDLARIEVPVADHPRLMESPLREEIALHFREVGFRLVEIDPRGFRSGSLNEALSK